MVLWRQGVREENFKTGYYRCLKKDLPAPFSFLVAGKTTRRAFVAQEYSPQTSTSSLWTGIEIFWHQLPKSWFSNYKKSSWCIFRIGYRILVWGKSGCKADGKSPPPLISSVGGKRRGGRGDRSRTTLIFFLTFSLRLGIFRKK